MTALSLRSWWTYILGYVLISIQGPFPERFVNMAVARGIFLWDITRITEDKTEAKVRIDAFRAMRHLARRTRCRVRIKSKYGLPFLIIHLRRRKMLVLGGVLFCAALYLLSSFIWFIEITGTEKLDPWQIQHLAAEIGLQVGTPKWKLDLPAIEKTISDHFPQLHYVHLYFRGTKAIVEVAEKVIIPEDDQWTPAHLVAIKDGVIQEILVMVGQAQVKEGDTVKKGQVLISGRIQPDPAPAGSPPGQGPTPLPSRPEPQLVHAKGIVRARVWYQGYAEMPLVQTDEQLTGRSQTGYYLEIGNYCITLKGPDISPYPVYRTEVWRWEYQIGKPKPVTLRLLKTTFREVVIYHREHSPTQTQLLAEEQALTQIKSVLPPDSLILAQRSEVIPTNDAYLVRVKVVVEALEEIAEPQPIHQETRRTQGSQIRRKTAR